MSQRLVIIMSICFLAGSLSAQTMINGGNVSGTWTVDNSPYLIYDEITIPNDSTLTIEPGVSVEFQGHYALQVQGRLLALGSENDTILFTINDSTGFSDPDTTLGGWNGIRFIDTPQSNDSSRIIFCKLEYGKAVADVWHLNAGGALCVINFDKVLVSNSLINHNIAGGLLTESPSGGAVHLAWSDIRFVETTFSYNSAHNGGAIQCHESSPTFIDCKFAYNIATESGGIAVDGECYVTLSDCQLLSNHSQNLGGGILFSSNSRSRLDNVTLAGNTANWGAGIGAFSCELELENCTLTGNVSSGLGGGIAIDNSQLNINNCTFMQNSAGTGGGIHSDKCDLQIENSMFEQNMTSSGDAGALNYLADTLIFDRPYQVNIINNRFIKNEAMGICGGIKLDQVNSDTSLIDIKIDQCEFDQNHANRVSPLRISGFISNFTLTNSLFRGNTSTQWTAGPGFVADCSGQVLNCVFSSNYAYKTDSSATLNGSSVGARAHVDYINCTITDTSNNGGVGLSFRGGATGTILNSIIWGCGDNPIHLRTTQEMGAAVYVNYCNLENGLDSVYISDSLSTLHWGIGNISEDPQFNDIQSGDLHLRDTSPGIGSGIDCFILDDVTYCAPETDIAGNPRPAPQGSNPDLGAFENNLAAPTFIDGTISDLPLHFGLDQNFPNPFNPTTKINYELPIANYVNLSVYNLLGQKMVTLVDEKQIAGQHQVIWNASEFASGVYLYRLKTESGYIETKKMILLR